MSDGELSPGRYVCLSVSDNGRGFDERIARRMFEPFFTTRLAGTGLGLATVREIVRDHDGAIGVQSRPGQGSRFEIWLPATAAGRVRWTSRRCFPLDVARRSWSSKASETSAAGRGKIGSARIRTGWIRARGRCTGACRSEPDGFDVILVSYGSRIHGPGSGAPLMRSHG